MLLDFLYACLDTLELVCLAPLVFSGFTFSSRHRQLLAFHCWNLLTPGSSVGAVGLGRGVWSGLDGLSPGQLSLCSSLISLNEAVRSSVFLVLLK